MADAKITALTANTTPVSTDIIPMVDDPAGSALTQKIAFTDVMALTANPVSNDGDSLGTTSLQWSDLFLAEGGVINWDNGDATLTQVSDVVTLAGADLKVTTPGDVSTSVVTTDATQTLTNKSLTSPVITGTPTLPVDTNLGTILVASYGYCLP